MSRCMPPEASTGICRLSCPTGPGVRDVNASRVTRRRICAQGPRRQGPTQERAIYFTVTDQCFPSPHPIGYLPVFLTLLMLSASSFDKGALGSNFFHHLTFCSFQHKVTNSGLLPIQLRLSSQSFLSPTRWWSRDRRHAENVRTRENAFLGAPTPGLFLLLSRT